VSIAAAFVLLVQEHKVSLAFRELRETQEPLAQVALSVRREIPALVEIPVSLVPRVRSVNLVRLVSEDSLEQPD